MRRLLVLLALVCCVLAVQTPAHAYHLYARLSTNSNGTAHVVTTCQKGRTLTVKAGTLTQSATVSAGTFNTAKLSKVAKAAASGSRITATCRPASGSPPHTGLAVTGVTVGQRLLLGMGLLGVGVVLLMIGYWEPPARPRRRRPPVKVYAQ